MPRDESTARWLRIGGRGGNVIFGVLFAVVGLRLWFSGGAGLCPFDSMSPVMVKVVGSGLIVGALLLLASRTALVGLFAVMAWILVWTWTLPALPFWPGRPCALSALILAGLFLNMGMIGLSGRGARPQRMTKLMLFFALAFLGHAVILWLRGR